jgi:[ribosomal protein S18]-alanine N-acetyltransferase
MISRGRTEGLFIAAWAFVVQPEHQRDFERAYGPNGDWVRLFRTGDGYIRTELHRDPNNPGRYITLDFWRSRNEYETFRESAKSAYQEIDTRCERLTVDEQLLGDLTDAASLHAAFPRLGPETQVRPIPMIRTAAQDDIPEIILLEQAASSAAHWTQAAYEAIGCEDAPVRMALVAESEDRKLSGFVVARIAADQCELENIVVSASESRQGIGSALLQELSQAARSRGVGRISLEVRESNLAARGLYEKLGFTRDGERVGYYSGPTENAILYSLTL